MHPEVREADHCRVDPGISAVVQKAVLGAMLRTLDRGRTPRNEYDNGQESALGGIRASESNLTSQWIE